MTEAFRPEDSIDVGFLAITMNGFNHTVMDALKLAEKYVFDECQEDYVGLWSILWKVRHVGVGRLYEVDAVLSIIRNLLSRGDIIAGEFEGQEFKEWDLSVEDTVRKIEYEWSELDRDPSGGDVVWITGK